MVFDTILTKYGQCSFYKCLFRHWECQIQRWCKSMFPTSVNRLPFTAWAGPWCAIWQQFCKMSSQTSNAMFYSMGYCVVLSPGNSPNCHMAGEEFWRGNNNGFVSSRQYSGWKWKRKYGTFGKDWLNFNSISIWITFSWNGKTWTVITIMHHFVSG